ncbi:MAG: hypothetical protein ACI8ZX_001742 [Planctomycetota bacterium]|jgi:hypothetical protein
MLVSKITITLIQIEQITMFRKLKIIKWPNQNAISFGRVSLDMLESNTTIDRKEIGLPNIYNFQQNRLITKRLSNWTTFLYICLMNKKR